MTKTYLETGEIEKLEAAATNMRDRLLIRLLFHLGCRISEALAIKVEDLDLTQGKVMIVHLKTRLKLSCPSCGSRLSITHAYCPRCGNKKRNSHAEPQEFCRQRILPIDEETIGMLRKYIKRGGPVEREGKTLIFGINRHRAWQIVRDCARVARLPPLVNPETGKTRGISPHQLRDAFSVHAMKIDDSGDGLRLLQEHLGHLSFNTTAKYRKIAGEEHRQWYDRLWRNKPY